MPDQFAVMIEPSAAPLEHHGVSLHKLPVTDLDDDPVVHGLFRLFVEACFFCLIDDLADCRI